MTQHMRVPDWVHETAGKVADKHDMTMKEAVAHMARVGGYDADD